MGCRTHFARSWSCLGSSGFPRFTILFQLNSSARAVEDMQPYPYMYPYSRVLSESLAEGGGWSVYIYFIHSLGIGKSIFISLTSFRNLTDSSHMPRWSVCFIGHVEGQLKNKGNLCLGLLPKWR